MIVNSPWITNVSLADVARGTHLPVPANAVLIQIVDPAMKFPTPASKFGEIHQFQFLDLDEVPNEPASSALITDEQAVRLVNILQTARAAGKCVVVHCVAGICRSGAVTEVGIMMGFNDTGAHRIPNVLVKTKMMRALAWTYDAD